MNTFKITLTLASPLVAQEGGYMTLDGLLAALKFEATGDLAQAHNDLPLQRTQGVWHASAAHIEAWHTGRMGFVANPHHGMACGFTPKVDSQLDVHHLKPVSQGERLTSLADVVVLCANCHRLAHSEDPPLPLLSLRALVL